MLLEESLGKTVELFRTKSGNDEEVTICQLLEEGEPIELFLGAKRQTEEPKPIPLFTITPWRREVNQRVWKGRVWQTAFRRRKRSRVRFTKSDQLSFL
jgi:hypothetical protein